MRTLAAPAPRPPATAHRPVRDALHGEVLQDDFRWLEDGSAAETAQWVAGQNAYVDAVLGRRPEVARMRRDLLRSIAQATVISSPAASPGRIFLLQRDPGQEQASLRVIEVATGTETVLYDPASDAGAPLRTVDWYHPSGGRYVAFGVSDGGWEESTLRIFDLEAGHELDERIARTRFCSLAWIGDDRFVYTRHPKPREVPPGEEWYNQHVWLHRVGTDPREDTEVFDRGRLESHELRFDASTSTVYFLSGDVWWRTAVHRQTLDRLGQTPETLASFPDTVFEGSPADGTLLLRTNRAAANFRIVAIDPDHPDEDSWRDIVPESADLVLRGHAVAKGRILVHAIRDVAAVAFILDMRTGERVEVELAPHGTISALGPGPDDDFLLLYESFTQAPTLYRVDPFSGALTLVRSSTTDAWTQNLAVDQTFYPSTGGTQVPMYLVHARDLGPGPHPLLLQGYGGMNIIRSATYMPEALPWLQQGGVLAVAHIRGGGEYGDRWRRAALGPNRQRSYDDFQAAAEYLAATGLTDADHLGVEGRSLGGLLVAVCLTQRPELYRAVVCGVPLIDMVRFPGFLIASRWTQEFGHPDVPEQYRWVRAYSPYHNVRTNVHYPAVYFFAGANDSRVDPMHPRKMAALLQETQGGAADPLPVLMRTEPNAGHGPGKPASAIVDEEAEIWGFLAWQLGLEAHSIS
jgi:prolyl oligopeptidase